MYFLSPILIPPFPSSRFPYNSFLDNVCICLPGRLLHPMLLISLHPPDILHRSMHMLCWTPPDCIQRIPHVLVTAFKARNVDVNFAATNDYIIQFYCEKIWIPDLHKSCKTKAPPHPVSLRWNHNFNNFAISLKNVIHLLRTKVIRKICKKYDT